MMKLRNRMSIRIPDRFAVLAAVTLTLTAAGSYVGDRALDDAQVSVETNVLPASAETHDPTSDDATQGGLASSLLLFRRG